METLIFFIAHASDREYGLNKKSEELEFLARGTVIRNIFSIQKAIQVVTSSRES